MLAALLLCGAANASTIGYWRMEVDNDPSANGLSVPNEMAFGTSLVSSEARLDAVNLPATTIPLTGLSNQSSIASAFQGGANGINASAAWYPELAVTSISVEFYARTGENTATPFRMSSGGLDGIVITDPNDVDITWHVDVGGTPTRFSMLDVHDMGTTWQHYAFVYDEATGIATFYVDGAVVGSFDGPDGAPLVILPGTAVEAGVLMDFASANQGLFDELRLDGSALAAGSLLGAPEPGTGIALGTGLLLLGARRRRGLRAAARA